MWPRSDFETFCEDLLWGLANFFMNCLRAYVNSGTKNCELRLNLKLHLFQSSAWQMCVSYYLTLSSLNLSSALATPSEVCEMKSFQHIHLNILVTNFFLINWAAEGRLSTYTVIWNWVSISLKYFFCFYWNKQNNNNLQKNMPQRQFKLKWITWKYQCFDLKCLVYSQFPTTAYKYYYFTKCFLFNPTRLNYYVFINI